MRGTVCHAPCATRGTKATAFAAEGNELLVVTNIATHAQEPMVQAAALQVVVELTNHIVRQLSALGGQQGLEVRPMTGAGYSCGLDTEGSTYCWGLGFPVDGNGPEHLRLSRGPLPHGARPVPLDMRDSRWSAFDTGDTQACGLTVEEDVYCFSATPLQGVDRRPIQIESDRTFVELAVGNRHACAIGTDGFAYCWGDGSAGQVGRPPSGRRW